MSNHGKEGQAVLMRERSPKPWLKALEGNDMTRNCSGPEDSNRPVNEWECITGLSISNLGPKQDSRGLKIGINARKKIEIGLEDSQPEWVVAL